MPRIRVHQHVNPLAPYFRFTPKPLDFGRIFADSNLPLHLDIGCARGRFLLRMAELFPQQNFLGLEIREPLVEEANCIKNEKNLTNLHYEFVNAAFALDKLLENLSDGILRTITIQFPDPWYKKKHSKRRMVRDNLVETLARHLTVSGKVFIQTDVEFLAAEMFELFQENKNFKVVSIEENPFPVKTEREKSVEERLLPIYRRVFEKR